MKRYRTFTVIGLMAALLLSSCSQEELGEQGMALPEGEYPLQIGSVTLTAEVSEQPWTRVSENPADGMSSVWEGGEQIGVQIGRGQPGIYTVQADGSVVAENPVYWTSTALTYVNAWYPVEETVNLRDQSDRLAYVLNATQDYVTYEQSVTLSFTHKLAKVRVVLSGTQAGQVESVAVYSITACNHLGGSLDYEASNKGWIKMKKQTYDNGTECWEANVVPREVISQIKVNNTEATLTKPLTPKMAALNTINLTVGEKITDIKDNTTINDNGYYRVSGTFNQQINITGGKPTIYLENASISVSSGPAINVTSGTPTIHVIGEGNSVSSGNNTGIAVSNGATVTITGNSTADVLTANGGNGGAGIGSPLGGATAGNVSITNVTIHATGSGESYPYFGGAGIGSSYNSPCGDITITNAVVNANGGNYSPGIGMGYGNRSQPSIGKITITNSDVTVRAGDFASAIGFPYTESADGLNPAEGYRAGQIIITTDDMDDFLSKLTAGGTVHSMYAEYAQRIGKGSYNKVSAPSVLNQNGTGPWEGVVINGTSYQDGVQ